MLHPLTRNIRLPSPDLCHGIYPGLRINPGYNWAHSPRAWEITDAVIEVHYYRLHPHHVKLGSMDMFDIQQYLEHTWARRARLSEPWARPTYK